MTIAGLSEGFGLAKPLRQQRSEPFVSRLKGIVIMRGHIDIMLAEADSRPITADAGIHFVSQPS